MMKLKAYVIAVFFTASFYIESYADKAFICNLNQWTEEEKAFWANLPDLSYLPDTFGPNQRLDQNGTITDQSSGGGFVGFAKTIDVSDNSKGLLNFKNGWIQDFKFWDENGTKMQESNWKEGLQHGSAIKWHSNGEVEEKSPLDKRRAKRSL